MTANRDLSLREIAHATVRASAPASERTAHKAQIVSIRISQREISIHLLLRADTMKNRSISELVDRAKDGDASAIGELYRLHCRRICNLCIRMTANQTEAEDLTQEIFLRAFRKVHTFRGQAAFSTWLYRLGVNVVLMRLRKKSYQEVIRPAQWRTRTQD